MVGLIDLDDPRAQNPLLTGAKASRLAIARRHGLPVLPGVVVPAVAARTALRRGARALERKGPAGARLAMTASELPPALTAALEEAARRLRCRSFAVRSSSVEEAAAVWAGAFASNLDVLLEELPAAVRACWAAAFTRDVLGRCEATGVRVEALRLAVLVQPCVQPEAGGVAVRHPGGAVTIVGVAGSPARLLRGLGDGVCVTVSTGGTVRGASDPLDATLAGQVAALVTEVDATTGCGRIEWARVGGQMVLLQLQPESPAGAGAELPHLPRSLVSDVALRAAHLIEACGGPMGEALLLPWALGSTDLPSAEPPGPSGPVAPAALGRAQRLAAELTAAVWGLPEPAAQAQAADLLRELRGSEPGAALVRLKGLRPAPRRAAQEFMSLTGGLAHRLALAGVLSAERQFWWLRPAELGSLLEGGNPGPVRSTAPLTAWHPFLCAVLAATSPPRCGTPVSAGLASGELRRIRRHSDARCFPPGAILLASHPAPVLAPLLWRAAGLVTWSGSPAAHLFEVAQSLRVPAVAACPVEDAGGALAGIDGDSGTVWVAGESSDVRREL